MTRPYKHSKTGTYWIRKTVPEPLRSLVGKRELKRSLRTKDATEARRLAPVVLAALEQEIASARMGQKFNRSDIEALAVDYYHRRTREILTTARYHQWSSDHFEKGSFNHEMIRDHAHNTEAEEAAILAWGTPLAQEELTSHQAFASPLFKESLAAALYQKEKAALDSAADSYFLHSSADIDTPRVATFRPPVVRSISTLFQQYTQTKKLRPRTVDDWGKMIAHFEEWLKGKPADKVTPADILQYGEYVRDGGGLSGRILSPKRVNEGYLAAIRSTYAWATKGGRELLTTNPAKGISVETPSSGSGFSRRGYTREEVATLLTAARYQETPYKRWIPWLLAFTGARVSEILNAKVADIGQTEDAWYIHLRPQAKGESGEHLKNKWSERCVPLHPALLSEGFLAYVNSLPVGGHLFPGSWKDKHNDRTKTPANRLRDWLNTVRPPEKGVAPNHSFRHWLISECKRASVDPDFQRQLTGHRAKDVHGAYGPGDAPVLLEQLKRIPSPFKQSENARISQ